MGEIVRPLVRLVSRAVDRCYFDPELCIIAEAIGDTKQLKADREIEIRG